MSEFSIISCISRPDVYNDCVIKSVNGCRGRHDIEFIPVLNLEGLYSASLALNVGINAATSDILVICHQDVQILGDWFTKLTETIAQLDDSWAILGSAGISLDYYRDDIGPWGGSLGPNTVAVGSVWDDDTKLAQPPYWDGEKSPTKCHCVDECLFVLRKSTGLRFDPLFNGFHFYGVDMCLQARAAGYNVYCADLPIIHFGKYSASFTNDSGYWLFLRKLYERWWRLFPEMLGTHMHWTESELTSYIPIELQSEDGCNLKIKSMGLGNVVMGKQ
jgi:glycosyltransferase involved in cell wall biosynthesis